MESELPASYISQLKLIYKHSKLFTLLLDRFKICRGCCLRIFNVMTPKLYSDDQSWNVLLLGYSLKINQNVFCWLCSGILQGPFLTNLTSEIVHKIQKEHFLHKKSFKLNVRIHNMLTVKYQIFCSTMIYAVREQFTPQEFQQLRKDIITPLFDKNPLEIKTVFKWILSNFMNKTSESGFNMKSTINEDENSVIVTINVENSSSELENYAGRKLAPALHLNAVKSKQNRNKKLKIDLEDESYQVKWTNGMVLRIGSINSQEWEQIYKLHGIDKMREMEEESFKFISSIIQLSSENLYICGRYVKFSRYLSQTPWIVCNKKMTQTSLQEAIQKRLYPFFYPQGLPLKEIQIKFHAGGRQDVDVRMLKGGRPFVLQFVSPRYHIVDVPVEKILEKIKNESPESFEKLPKIEGLSPEELQAIKVNLLQLLVNSKTESCKALNLQKTTAKYISNELKQAQGQKIKHYVCYIKSEEPFDPQDKEKLEKCHNLAISQKTPIRVLHRRTLMYRDKMVHQMIFHQVTKYSAVLQIWASAGTYIKEFVHGDMNRTLPNVGTILSKQVDILQLDVGSLKEGEWEQGAQEDMKLGTLQWQS